MGGLFSLIVTGGAVALRESNSSIATMLGSLVFSLGFVLIIITNVELATANMFVMPYTTLQRKTSVLTMGRVIGISYLYNLCGCLFFAWFLAYWTDSLSADEKAFAVAQAEARVQVANYWSTNFLRAVGCNWLVCLAYFLSTGAREYVSKIYAVSFPVWAFGALGYQHSVAIMYVLLRLL
jgi:formate/nitrite transporter